MRFIFAILFFALSSGIAIAQEAAVLTEEGSLLGLLNNFPGLMKLLVFVAALQIFLRGLAEALTRLADYTETKWDNKAAAWASEASWILGVALGKIGYGEPKAVTQAKIEAATEPKK